MWLMISAARHDCVVSMGVQVWQCLHGSGIDGQDPLVRLVRLVCLVCLVRLKTEASPFSSFSPFENG
jgi:hypothetical protein